MDRLQLFIIRSEVSREIHAKREEGKTQQQIANEVGLSRQRVTQVLQVNPAIAEKTSKPKRVEICLKINAGTNPSVAAAKIRDVGLHQVRNQTGIRSEIRPTTAPLGRLGASGSPPPPSTSAQSR